MFKNACTLNHSKGSCPLGEECCSKGKTKLIEARFYERDGTLIEATPERMSRIEVAVKEFNETMRKRFYRVGPKW